MGRVLKKLIFVIVGIILLFLCKFYIESIIIYNSKMFNSIWNDFTEKYEDQISKKDIIGYGYREAKYFEEKAKDFDLNNVNYLKLPEKEQNQLLWTLYGNFQSYISFGKKIKKNLSSSTTSKYDTEYRAEGVLWGERNDPNYFSSTCIIDEVKYVYYVLF